MEKKSKAIEAFQSGINCAQAVLLSFADELEFDETLALQISSGFGAGMGRLHKTCGAVTAAFMVIGIYNCKKEMDHDAEVNQNCKMIQEFNRRFLDKYPSTDCSGLIGCDLNTEEGRRRLKETMLKEKICNECVADAVEIVENLIADDSHSGY